MDDAGEGARGEGRGGCVSSFRSWSPEDSSLRPRDGVRRRNVRPGKMGFKLTSPYERGVR